MTTAFGIRLRKLRKDKGFSQKRLAAVVGVHHTYVSKVESGKLDFALYPGEELVRKLAVALDADETELLLLAKKVPPLIRDRVLERPDDFCKLAALDDASLDEVIRHVDRRKKTRV
jgi:HTH-type transcriptional regulator, competence development regulator